MSVCHHREFTNFVLNRKKARNGALRMDEDEVTSYAMTIAVVDRYNKTIYFDGRKVSRTTNMHQSAVTSGFHCELKELGWQLLPMSERP